MITAIDIGATKTLVAQFNDKGEPTKHERFLTAPSTDAFLQDLKDTLAHFDKPSAISIGAPGELSEDGGTFVAFGNLSWRNVALQEYLMKEYGCPVYLENDANLAALYEINNLSPVPQLGLYVTISTGIGSGIILNGKLAPGLRRSEIGHIVLQTNGDWKEWEDIVSGKAIKAHFGQLAQDLHGDQWEWVTDHIATGLVTIIPTLRPDVIVFGGGVGTYFDRFGDMLVQKVRQRTPVYIADLPTFTRAKHPEEAVLYGCYYNATHRNAR